MDVAGLPLHPLVIHAAVVLTPLAAVLVAVFAAVPRWRWLTRWPAAVTTLLSAGSVWVAKVSGDALLRSRPYLLTSPQLADRIHLHQSRGGVLLTLTIGFLVLTAVGVWALGGPSPLAGGRGARRSRAAALELVLPTVLVLSAVVVLAWVVLTGDAGARAVWGS